MTTPAFAVELLAAPPRVAAGAEAPERATLGALQLVPGELAGGELVSLELVGEIRREGERSPLSISLRRTPSGWRVDTLGR